jgi:hypothetical protein
MLSTHLHTLNLSTISIRSSHPQTNLPYILWQASPNQNVNMSVLFLSQDAYKVKFQKWNIRQWLPTKHSVRKTKRIIKQPLLCFYQKRNSKLRPSLTQRMGPVCKTEAAKVSHDLDLTTGAWQGYLNNNFKDEFHTYLGRANVRPQTQPLGKIDHLTKSPSTFIRRNVMCRSKSAERRNPLSTSCTVLTIISRPHIKYSGYRNLVTHLNLAPKYKMRVEFTSLPSTQLYDGMCHAHAAPTLLSTFCLYQK